MGAFGSDSLSISNTTETTLTEISDDSTTTALSEAVGGDVSKTAVTEIDIAGATGPIDLSVLDAGAVAGALELGGDAVAAASGIAGESAATAREAIQSAIDLAGKKIETPAQTATKFGIWIFVIIAAVFGVREFQKRKG